MAVSRRLDRIGQTTAVAVIGRCIGDRARSSGGERFLDRARGMLAAGRDRDVEPGTPNLGKRAPVPRELGGPQKGAGDMSTAG